MLLLVGVVWLYQFFYESKFREVLANGSVRVSAGGRHGALFVVCSSGGGTFIYFQF